MTENGTARDARASADSRTARNDRLFDNRLRSDNHPVPEQRVDDAGTARDARAVAEDRVRSDTRACFNDDASPEIDRRDERSGRLIRAGTGDSAAAEIDADGHRAVKDLMMRVAILIRASDVDPIVRGEIRV